MRRHFIRASPATAISYRKNNFLTPISLVKKFRYWTEHKKHNSISNFMTTILKNGLYQEENTQSKVRMIMVSLVQGESQEFGKLRGWKPVFWLTLSEDGRGNLETGNCVRGRQHKVKLQIVIDVRWRRTIVYIKSYGTELRRNVLSEWDVLYLVQWKLQRSRYKLEFD